jgi:hypothetical protein
MKLHFILIFLGCVVAHARVSAHGHGFFPIVVVVTTEKGLPIKGVTVQLEDSGKREAVSADERYWMNCVGLPAETNAHGAAVLVYYGGWVSTKDSKQEIYSRSVHGKVVVDIPGYERTERAVSDVVGGKNTSVGTSWAPVIQITLKRKP